MTNAVLVKEESTVVNGFIPATGALTVGIFVSLCKDIAAITSSVSLERCKQTLAYHYTEWCWNHDL